MDLTAFTASFVLLHWGIASATRIPELQIYEEEAEAVAKSLTNLMRHYNVPMVNDKIMAWGGLATVLGQIYAPRVKAIFDRQNAVSENRPVPAPPGTEPFVPAVPPELAIRH